MLIPKIYVISAHIKLRSSFAEQILLKRNLKSLWLCFIVASIILSIISKDLLKSLLRKNQSPYLNPKVNLLDYPRRQEEILTPRPRLNLNPFGIHFWKNGYNIYFKRRLVQIQCSTILFRIFAEDERILYNLRFYCFHSRLCRAYCIIFEWKK